MLRWTSATVDGVGAPAPDARLPHAATLIGGALVVLSLFVPVRVLASDYVAATAAPFVLATVVVAAVFGLGLITAVPHRIGWLAVGLVLLDLIPAVLVLTAPEPIDARARTFWLVIPTVLAAANSGRLIPATQGALGCLLGTGVLLAAGLRGVDAALEIAVLVGVLVVATMLVGRMARQSAERRAELTRASRTDPLTGVLNRRGLIEAFPVLKSAAASGSGRIGVLLLDIDRFKQLNDRLGHARGDIVLREVAELLSAAAGPGAVVGRIGGEELVALLAADPAPIAASVRESLAARADLGVTVSIGIVHEPVGPDAVPATLGALVLAADRALYRAKDDGRDRVRLGRMIPTTRSARAPVPAAAPVPIAREHTPTRIGPRTLLALCLTIDLVVVAALLVMAEPAGRRVAVTVLVIPSLLVAARLPRPVLLAQYLLVAAACAWVAYRPEDAVDLAVLGHAALSTVQLMITILGPAELIFRISRRHEASADELHRWTVTDPLTGAANRRGLELAFAARGGFVGAVVAVDVDKFKTINDRLGHAGGDDALIRLVGTLREVIGTRGVVARTGGDEFVLITGPGEMRAPAELAELVRGAGRALPVPLSLSVGQVAAAAGSGSSIWDLVALADLSLIERRTAARDGAVPPARPAPWDAHSPRPAVDPPSSQVSAPGSVASERAAG